MSDKPVCERCGKIAYGGLMFDEDSGDKLCQDCYTPEAPNYPTSDDLPL